MKILVTGSEGFIGRNLVSVLETIETYEVLKYDIGTNESLLDHYLKNADFIFHLAGVNRSDKDIDFMTGNTDLTNIIISKLKQFKNTCPIMISSSIQANNNSIYGKSKKSSERIVFDYSDQTGVQVFVYRFSNVFGKWSKPNYNSVIATFSYNICRGLPIKINDPNTELRLIYIDDLVNNLINCIYKQDNESKKIYYVEPEYNVKLSEISELLYSFYETRNKLNIVDLKNEFTKKLYSCYISYLPVDNFSYNLKMNIDERGSFTELFKTIDRGQISVNIIKPGITKGNHWHQSKTEKFIVVKGTGIIRFRAINNTEIIEYKVSGKYLTIVDIPPGYTHNIQNIGEDELVTIMWVNEIYDANNPDTYYLEV